MGSDVHMIAPQKKGAVRAIAQPDKNQKTPNIGDVFIPHGVFNGIWVPESLLRCPDLPAASKLLYGRLARFAGKDGRCFPSVETLAQEMGMTARQIQRLLVQLCKARFLRKEAQYRSDGSQTSNAYFFLYHASLAPAIPTIGPCTPLVSDRKGPARSSGVTKVSSQTRMSPRECLQRHPVKRTN
jgi:hypothetical protein